MEKLVSVPVLTYNAESFIEETLESIFNQTYQTIELIISDDCSKDNTVQIVEKWCAQPRVIARFTDIKIITVPKNTGIPAFFASSTPEMRPLDPQGIAIIAFTPCWIISAI